MTRHVQETVDHQTVTKTNYVTKQQVNVLQDVSLVSMDGLVTTRVVNTATLRDVNNQQVNILQDVSLVSMDRSVTTRAVNCVCHIHVTNRTDPVNMDASVVTKFYMVFVKESMMKVSVLSIYFFQLYRELRFDLSCHLMRSCSNYQLVYMDVICRYDHLMNQF